MDGDNSTQVDVSPQAFLLTVLGVLTKIPGRQSTAFLGGNENGIFGSFRDHTVAILQDGFSITFRPQGGETEIHEWEGRHHSEDEVIELLAADPEVQEKLGLQIEVGANG